MTPKFTKRIKGFLTSHFPLHLLAFVLLWITIDAKALAITLCVYSAIMAGIVMYGLFRTWREARQRVYADHCIRLEALLHDIVDLAFTYEDDHTKFYRKFLETVNVKSLVERGVINPDAMLKTSKHNRRFREMKRGDAELLALLAAGFSYREIKIIYGLKNLNSVYIKTHRLRSRLSDNMQRLAATDRTPMKI